MFSLIRKRYCHIFEPRCGFQNWGLRSLGVKGTWVIGRLSYKSGSNFFFQRKARARIFLCFRWHWASLLPELESEKRFSFVGGRVRLRVGYIILESSGRYCDRKSAALKIGSWQYRENCEPPPLSQKVTTLSESRFKKIRPNNNFLVLRE